MGRRIIVKDRQRVPMEDLDIRQRAFCEYLVAERAYNPNEAARKAGYKNPGKTAANLLTGQSKAAKAARAYIGKLQRERAERLEVTADDVLRELACIGLRDPIDMVDPTTGLINLSDLSKIPARTRVCIESMEVVQTELPDGTLVQKAKLKFSSKLGALEMLAKHFGLLEYNGEGPNDGEGPKPIPWDRLLAGPTAEQDPIRAAILAVEAERLDVP